MPHIYWRIVIKETEDVKIKYGECNDEQVIDGLSSKIQVCNPLSALWVDEQTTTTFSLFLSNI